MVRLGYLLAFVLVYYKTLLYVLHPVMFLSFLGVSQCSLSSKSVICKTATLLL